VIRGDSGILKRLAQAEKGRATDLGTAGVTFATGMVGADYLWTLAVTSSAGTLAVGEHAAWQSRTSSITGARNTLAGEKISHFRVGKGVRNRF